MSALDCARASAWMTAAEAGRLAEDDACRLEDHVQRCPDCRAARERLAALAAVLREAPDTGARPTAMGRAISRALAGERPGLDRRPSPTGRRGALAAAAFAGAVALSWWWLASPGAPPPPAEASLVGGAVRAEGRPFTAPAALPLHEELVATAAASVRLPAASLRLEAEGRMSIESPDAIVLRAGQVHAAVRPGTPFEVRTGAFRARVRGTRFVVTSASVEVRSGRVEVWSLEGSLLATLGPGGRWSVAVEPVGRVAQPSSAAPVEEGAPPRPPVAGGPPGHGPVAARGPAARAPEPVVVAPPSPPQPPPTLADVRAALRARETGRARDLLARLAGTAGVSRAEVDVLHADSLRLERRFAEAVGEYHAIAGRYPGSAAAEAALFTAAQLELDRLGRTAAARRSLQAYRRRHPNGRFRAEVERILAQITPSEETR